MDAIQLISDHHQQISGLFDLIEKSPDLGEKLTLFQRLKEEMELHSLLEEKVLYPAVSSHDEISEILDRAYEQHDEMNDFLEEIDQMEVEAVEGDHFDTAIDEFDDAVSELRTLFNNHMQDESRALFPKITELLDPDDLVALSNEMNELRNLGMAA